MASRQPTAPATVDRVQPQAVEVERAVLGAMMIDNGVIPRVVEILGDESAFYQPAHRRVYAALLSLFDQGRPADQVIVVEELVKRGAGWDVRSAGFWRVLDSSGLDRLCGGPGLPADTRRAQAYWLGDVDARGGIRPGILINGVWGLDSV